MEGPCLPPYAMGTDVINFYLYCLFSLLNTAQKWMFIDISESTFFPTKLLQIWSKMRHLFLCLSLSLSDWQHNLSFLPSRHLLHLFLSIYLSVTFEPQWKGKTEWRLWRCCLVLSCPHFPQTIVFIFIAKPLFPISLPKICNSELCWEDLCKWDPLF